ncbi:MAG: hypothetical protein ACPG4T_19240, partial [Nannocystaceae bacterium]
ALLHKPAMLICDEPTGNLDRASGDAILNLFYELNRTAGLTLIIVTHDDLIAEAAQRVVRIVEGNVVEDRKSKGEPGQAAKPSESAESAESAEPEPAEPAKSAHAPEQTA